MPITRGQDLGLRFRPDERETPYAQTPAPYDAGAATGYPSELHSQFRPLKQRRKPTYEELQAEQQPPQPVARPAMPYPVMPVPPIPTLPGYGPYWPRW